jgi:hypothetical protein
VFCPPIINRILGPQRSFEVRMQWIRDGSKPACTIFAGATQMGHGISKLIRGLGYDWVSNGLPLPSWIICCLFLLFDFPFERIFFTPKQKNAPFSVSLTFVIR